MTDEEKKFSCFVCVDNPGWVTYYLDDNRKRCEKDHPNAHFTASPCPDCDLGKRILENILKKRQKKLDKSED